MLHASSQALHKSMYVDANTGEPKILWVLSSGLLMCYLLCHIDVSCIDSITMVLSKHYLDEQPQKYMPPDIDQYALLTQHRSSAQIWQSYVNNINSLVVY